MNDEKAEHGALSKHLNLLGAQLDRFLQFDHPDAMTNVEQWKDALGGSLPEAGIGIEKVLDEMGDHLIPNGS